MLVPAAVGRLAVQRPNVLRLVAPGQRGRRTRLAAQWTESTWTAMQTSRTMSSMMASTAPAAFAARISFMPYTRATPLPVVLASLHLVVTDSPNLNAVVAASEDDDDG
jgi:hypothetical protein